MCLHSQFLKKFVGVFQYNREPNSDESHKNSIRNPTYIFVTSNLTETDCLLCDVQTDNEKKVDDTLYNRIVSKNFQTF